MNDLDMSYYELFNHKLFMLTGQTDFQMDKMLPGCSLSGQISVAVQSLLFLQSSPLAFTVCQDPTYTKDMP